MKNKLKALYVVVEFALTVGVVMILMKLFYKHNRTIRRVWAKMQKHLIGYSIKVEGKADKDVNMLLINHQSLLDIVVLEELHPDNLAWVAKKEIAEIPIWGNILSIPKMIIIDRESKSSLVKLFKDVKDRLANNRVIAIFPEGTRGRGDKLLKFKDGTRHLAEKLKLKVQPVVIVGSRRVLDSQNLTSQRGEIKVIYLDSINPNEDKDWYKKVQEDMKETLAKHTQLT